MDLYTLSEELMKALDDYDPLVQDEDQLLSTLRQLDLIPEDIVFFVSRSSVAMVVPYRSGWMILDFSRRLDGSWYPNGQRSYTTSDLKDYGQKSSSE